MNSQRIIVICNALDDVTRIERQITTDSPAASRKIFKLCAALRLAGVRPWVVSLGRGKAGGSSEYFSSHTRRTGGVSICYAPFSRIPVISELISLFGLAYLVLKFRRRNYKTIIFYNRMSAYVPALLISALLRNRNILELEDGEVTSETKQRTKVIPKLIDRLCSGGVLVTCKALIQQTSIRPVLCYYGTAEDEIPVSRFQRELVTVLMGGTLTADTGVDLLIDVIKTLRTGKLSWIKNLSFQVTGKGPGLDDLQKLADEPRHPQVIVHGRTTDSQYRQILNQCDVGLALKTNSGPLANTTFPSKVIEFASAGLLVLTTDISDVREVLQDGAMYLTTDDPQELIKIFKQIANNRNAASDCAKNGRELVQQRCSPVLAGNMVSDFVFGDRQ